jgi:hypothetical protein
MAERTAKMIESRRDVDVRGRSAQSGPRWLGPGVRGSTWGACGSTRGARGSVGDWLAGLGDV